MTQGISKVTINGGENEARLYSDPCWIESIDLELAEVELYIDALKAEMKNLGETTAVLKVGWKNRLEDPLVWEEPIQLSDLDPIFWTRFTARYIRLRFEDETPSSLWKLSSLEFFGHKGGGRL